jgi:imidazole glycerol-phosphate synthase subunit HisH
MIVVVDSGVGNLGSIVNMFAKVGVAATVSSDPAMVRDADKIVLPGVGSFDNAMESLERRGLRAPLEQKALSERVPVLGVCLGMQLLTEGSEEGTLPGLGWVKGHTIRFDFGRLPDRLRTPHMGWNTLARHLPHPLLADLGDQPKFYFVHSYHVVCRDAANVMAETLYGYHFASALCEGNILGVQFHPEKSHRFGMQLFRNFAALPKAAEAQGQTIPAGAVRP